MSNVVVAVFKHQQDVTKIMADLRRMVASDKVRITDACGIHRDHTGSVKLNQMFQRIDRFFIAGMTAGLLAGFFGGLVLFGFLPAVLTALCGAFAGLASAALLAMMKDYGLNDDFIYKIGSELDIDTSALMILHAPGSADALIRELEQMQAKVFQTQYGPREQQDMQDKLSGMLHAIPEGAPRPHANTW
jgi:uncharacterized membrane protein